jgi:hypothetical protein
MNNSRNRIRTITHKNKLFRANTTRSTVGNRASNSYAGAPMKYFTLNEGELQAYTKYGKPFKKTWKPTSDLILIDILDMPTRKVLETYVSSESLNTAFPIIRNKVSRRSNEDTRNHDDAVLSAICQIRDNRGAPLYDGYYMKAIHPNNNNSPSFHSEVGLCAHALSKLTLNSEKKNIVPPRAPAKKRRPNSNSI